MLDIKELFDARTLANRVHDLGRQLQREVGPTDPLVLSVLGGSVVFLADLVRAIKTPLRYEFIHVGQQEEAEDSAVALHYPVPIDVRDQHLLVVKDVVSSAVIETYLRNQFLEMGARRVQVVALVDLPKERTVHFQVDYSVFTTQRNARLVGYGLKLDGRYGGLPYVGYLNS